MADQCTLRLMRVSIGCPRRPVLTDLRQELNALEKSDQLGKRSRKPTSRDRVGTPLLTLTAMTVHYKEGNVREISALILGPPGTPYALGFYEVGVHYTENSLRGTVHINRLTSSPSLFPGVSA